MFILSDSVQRDSTISADICVVGSGAAGISFVLEFLNSKTRLCVIESGDFKVNRIDPLYDFESPRLPIALDSRVRAFGGTTTAWSGRWKWLDDIDFRRRDWVPNSGWPIGREDIERYYQRASQSLKAPDPAKFDGKPGFLHSAILEPRLFLSQQKKRWRWGDNFRAVLKRSEVASIYLNAHMVRIEESSATVAEIHVRTPAGNAFKVKAQAFVLAAGGIENARLLLLSNIGNQHDQVGRYYMDHPKGHVGIIEAYRQVDLSNHWDLEIESGRAAVGFRLSDAIQEKYRILNSHILLEPLPERSLANQIRNKIFPIKKSHVVLVRNHLEQAPVASNRVCLSDKRDFFGCPKARVDWSISELDKKTIVVFHGLLQKELQRLRIGELNSSLLDKDTPDFPITRDASHHLGATRMGADPRNSVVDRNCKVHSTANLFIAGSSVFPTSGHANPTATIAALAIRLADHLKDKI